MSCQDQSKESAWILSMGLSHFILCASRGDPGHFQLWRDRIVIQVQFAFIFERKAKFARVSTCQNSTLNGREDHIYCWTMSPIMRCCSHHGLSRQIQWQRPCTCNIFHVEIGVDLHYALGDSFHGNLWTILIHQRTWQGRLILSCQIWAQIPPEQAPCNACCPLWMEIKTYCSVWMVGFWFFFLWNEDNPWLHARQSMHRNLQW